MDPNKILDRQKATVSNLLKIYDGKTPLHLYLKKYFAENKKHGSKDRKTITGLCYSYFRLGQNVWRLQKENTVGSLSEILSIAGYISGMLSWPEELKAPPEHHRANTPADRFQRISELYPQLTQDALFPFKAALSEGLDLSAFRNALLNQPDLFIRIRPPEDNHARVLKTLKDHDIGFRETGAHALALPAQTPVGQLLVVNKQIVIQDISSQRMSAFFEMILQHRKSNESLPTGHRFKIWDCCAASGGKSLLAWDSLQTRAGKIALTVSDIRISILKNLEKRFQEAGITGYKKHVLDLLLPAPLPFTHSFDLVICDVPCTGSGTWARNPENIAYFDENTLSSFYDKQTRIARKAWQAVSPGGYFLYMTCSVFAGENEQVTQFISQNSGMELVDSKLITGYGENGDSMFGALFTRIK